MKENCIKKEIIYDGKIIRVEKDEIEMDNGHRSMREVVFNSGGVAVLALTNDHKVVLAKQFRYPSKEELLEIPGGKQEQGESYVDTAKRELLEETGYVSDDVTYLGYLYPTVAYCSEVIHLALAKNCVYTKQHLDEGEFVDIVIMDYEEAIQKVLDNTIKDGKTIVALLKYHATQK